MSSDKCIDLVDESSHCVFWLENLFSLHLERTSQLVSGPSRYEQGMKDVLPEAPNAFQDFPLHSERVAQSFYSLFSYVTAIRSRLSLVSVSVILRVYLNNHLTSPVPDLTEQLYQ